MWQLEYPWLLFLLPLALLAYLYLGEYREARSAVRVPFFNAMSRAIGQTPSRSGARGSWQLLLNLLVWALLVVAVTRPVWVEKPIEQRQPVRDIILAIDISQSMETTDFATADGLRVDRLSAVRQVLQGFITKRKDDRLGLVVFGTGAYLQAPLTLDHPSLTMLLDEIGIGMAGPNTAIGDAIGLTIKVLASAQEEHKLLILLTDGNDTGSAIAPQRAAELAANRGIVIHTIGIGDLQATDQARVDFATLEQIARRTGGRFFRAEDGDALQQVYDSIDSLTAHEVKTLSHQPRRDLFWVPLGAAMSLLALYHLIALLGGRIASAGGPSQARES